MNRFLFLVVLFLLSPQTRFRLRFQEPPPPSITLLNPNSGLVGTAVTITGANLGNLQGASTISFNGTAATATSWTATSVGTTAPTGATTGNVTLTVRGIVTNGLAFTVTSGGAQPCTHAASLASTETYAASTSQADVQSAINTAASGNTVCVPAGSSTWASAVIVTGKTLTLRGQESGCPSACVDNTVITDGLSGNPVLQNYCTSSNFVRVTSFNFVKGPDKSGGTITFDPDMVPTASAVSVCFRFDHNHVSIPSAASTHFLVPEIVYGLVDHNLFDITATTGQIGVFDPFGSADGNDGGFTPWSRSLSLGTNQAVYFEDNRIANTTQDAGIEDCIDAYGGARFVIRHNTIINCSIGFHGTDSGNRRSIVSFEIYNNTFTNNSSVHFRAATIRGGTGVVFNNTYSGPTWNGITLMLYRVVQPTQVSAWQTCNGTNWEIGDTNFSAQASRTASTNGGVCFSSVDRESVGACGTGNFTTYFDTISATGYQCRDQPGVKPGQSTEAIYKWSNGSDGGIGSYDGGSGISDANYLQSGRDYIDNNTTAKPGYTSYTYPHPLNTTP